MSLGYSGTRRVGRKGRKGRKETRGEGEAKEDQRGRRRRSRRRRGRGRAVRPRVNDVCGSHDGRDAATPHYVCRSVLNQHQAQVNMHSLKHLRTLTRVFCTGELLARQCSAWIAAQAAHGEKKGLWTNLASAAKTTAAAPTCSRAADTPSGLLSCCVSVGVYDGRDGSLPSRQ